MRFEEPIYIGYGEFFDVEAFSRLKKKFVIQALNLKEALTEKKNILHRIQILLIRSRVKVDKNLIQKMPALKLVITMTSGFDHMDLNVLKDSNIKVSHTPHIYAESVSELVFLFMLSLLRKVFSFKKMKKEEKKFWKEDFLRGSLLKGKRLGILGLGNIGSAVSQKAQAFGMEVMAFDPYVSKERFKVLGVISKDFKGLLESSDILSLHVPLNRETQHLINEKALKILPKGALIINTSRGGVVNEKDLLQALKRNEIGGLALDVFEKEPLDVHSSLFSYTHGGLLYGHSNVFLTPHIGSYTEEVFRQASKEAVDILLKWLETGELKNALPDSLSWWKKKRKMSDKEKLL